MCYCSLVLVVCWLLLSVVCRLLSDDCIMACVADVGVLVLCAGGGCWLLFVVCCSLFVAGWSSLMVVVRCCCSLCAVCRCSKVAVCGMLCDAWWCLSSLCVVVWCV